VDVWVFFEIMEEKCTA